MKTISQIREASGGKEAYQKFFNSLLKKFGVSSPSELKGDKKKEFFDAIDKGWDGDNEKAESKKLKASYIKSNKDKMNASYNKSERYNDPDNLDPDTDVDADEDQAEKAASQVTEKTKLKAGKGKITVDLNWDGSAADKKFAETKYKIKLKITRTGALVSGEKARVLAYISGQDYAMDDEDIEDLMPEILQNGNESVSEAANSAQLKKAQAIASKNSGDMEAAIAEIEKIKKGLSNDKKVMAILKTANESVSVDRRTVGFKEAMKRAKEAKAKREAMKIKAAKKQAKNDMANIDANYAYDGDIEEILTSANKKIMGQHEDAAANASSSGAVDMNPTGKPKKKEKENLMAKYGY